MSTAPSTLPDDDLAAALAAADEPHRRAGLARQFVILSRLAEIALESAEVLGRRIKACDAAPDGAAADGEGAPAADDAAFETPADAAADVATDTTSDPTPAEPRQDTLAGLGLTLDRVSRAARLSCILQTRVIEELRRAERIADGRAAEAAAVAQADHAARDHERKGRIQKIVERIAEADHPGDAEQVDGLVTAACLQLRDRERFGDVLKRPISEIIGLICDDLGLAPDWPRLAEETWAREEIAGGQMGGPLAAYVADPARFKRVRRRRPPRPAEVKPSRPAEPGPTKPTATDPPGRPASRPVPTSRAGPPPRPRAQTPPGPTPPDPTPVEPWPGVDPEAAEAPPEIPPDPAPAPSPPPFVPEQPWLAPSWSPHPQAWGGEPIYLPGEGPPPRRPRIRR